MARRAVLYTAKQVAALRKRVKFLEQRLSASNGIALLYKKKHSYLSKKIERFRRLAASALVCDGKKGHVRAPRRRGE
eukprot:7580934-Pyramimonas_sp.AAC.1